MKKSQSAFEYLAVLAVMLMVLVPATYYALIRTTQVSDDVMLSEAKSSANKLISAARDVYFSAGSAKRTIDISVGEYVSNITSENNDTIVMQLVNNELHTAISPVPINVTVPKDFVKTNKYVVEKKQGYVLICAYGQCE